ncbi:hypothetical protein RclHR1_13900008 [Rhizophagus clarus]|uniref:Calcium activated cation channel n=1 Tax=Rhizophagus clarus TaxID=94130 RepID=A0A2Z6QD44_9GLOM|nr:hypothetical protein RclHR1_13900008 [Rhizophagus clarus]GES86240.1 calcium activated cation channel [Rhizophagus clarus]
MSADTRTPLINDSQHSYYCLTPESDDSSNKSCDDEQNNFYEEINERLSTIRDVIKNLVPLGTIKHAEELITDPVVDYVFERCNKDPSMVFVVLYYARGLQKMIKADGHAPALRSMRTKRIECSELLAIELIHKFDDQELIFTKVLTKRYAFSQYDDLETRKNALDLAARIYSEESDHCTLFLSDDEVQACLYALWSGHLMPSQISDISHNVAVTDYHIPMHSSNFYDTYKNLDLLCIPRNQYLLYVIAYIAFLLIYTLFANIDEIREYDSYLEGIMYILVFSFILNDIRLFQRHGIKHFKYLRKFLSFIIYAIFITDMLLRIRNFLNPDNSLPSLHRTVLSLVPLFLHWRVLLLLDAFQPIGRWLTQISRILKKSMSYYILLSLAFIAFFQSFLVLQDSYEHRDDVFNGWGIFKLLIKGILIAPDFQTASELEHKFGFLLYSFYVFLVSIILFAVLLPLFMTALTTKRTVPEEYLSHFANLVLKEVRDQTRYNYPPPFNILYYILILPIYYIFGRKRNVCSYVKILTRIIFFIPMIIFTLIQIRMGKNNQEKDVRDIDIKELPDLPIPQDENQMLRRILHKLEVINEQQNKLQSRLENIESHLGVYSA